MKRKVGKCSFNILRVAFFFSVTVMLCLRHCISQGHGLHNVSYFDLKSRISKRNHELGHENLIGPDIVPTRRLCLLLHSNLSVYDQSC